MAERAGTLGSLAGLVLCIGLASGCIAGPAVAPPVGTPAPSAPAAAEITAVAEILRLEDSRLSDAQRFDALARSGLPRVRARTALALGRLRRPESLSTLIPLLSDPDSAVAATAVFALGQVADSTSVPHIAPLLDSAAVRSRPTVAAEAAYALGKLRSIAARQRLEDFLRLAPAASPPEVVGSALLAVWRFPRPADITPITRWTSSTHPDVRWKAVYAITRRPHPSQVGLLLTLAGDASGDVRAQAVRGLTAAAADSAGIPRDSILRILVAGAGDPHYPARVNAVRSLGTFPEALTTLRALLTATEPHLVLTALESLGRLGARAAPAANDIAAIAESPRIPISIRQSALEALATVSRGDAERLGRAFAGDPSWRLRAGAARALADPRGAVGAELRRLMGDADPRVAASALQAAVDAVGDSVALLRPVLLEQLLAPDPYARMVTLTALAKLRDPSLLPPLLDAYDRARRDTVNDAALAALDALAALKTTGTDPARAFFARFARSPDFLVRRKAEEHFGAAATAAWGPTYPPDDLLSSAGYLALAEEWAAAVASDASYPLARIVTEVGTVTVRLFPEAAPMTTRNFRTLATGGFFDGQEWPRVVANFVVQGGDPRGDTNGGPGYVIRDELNRHQYRAGTVGMALSGPDTGGSQFFATHSPQPHLDGVYTVFGEVVEGAELLERILPGEIIRSVTVAP